MDCAKTPNGGVMPEMVGFCWGCMKDRPVSDLVRETHTRSKRYGKQVCSRCKVKKPDINTDVEIYPEPASRYPNE